MDGENRLDTLTPQEIQALIDDGVISGGMIPKVNSALSALSEDVEEVIGFLYFADFSVFVLIKIGCLKETAVLT